MQVYLLNLLLPSVDKQFTGLAIKKKNQNLEKNRHFINLTYPSPLCIMMHCDIHTYLYHPKVTTIYIPRTLSREGMGERKHVLFIQNYPSMFKPCLRERKNQNNQNKTPLMQKTLPRILPHPPLPEQKEMLNAALMNRTSPHTFGIPPLSYTSLYCDNQ